MGWGDDSGGVFTEVESVPSVLLSTTSDRGASAGGVRSGFVDPWEEGESTSC